MSLKLRLKYHYRSLWRAILQFSLPAWLHGRVFKVSIFGFAALFAAGYLYQVNSISTSGYIIHDLEKRVGYLADEEQRLTSKVAELQSLATIGSRLPEVSMVPASALVYIASVESAAVAQR